MNILQFLGLDVIVNFQKKRNDQLKKQEEQDIILSNIKNDCPQEVCRFFLFQRSLNRQLMMEYDTSSILSYVKITEDSLNTVADDMEFFELLVNKNFSNNLNCQNLKKYNDSLKKKI